jgi:carbohydrate-selective porin OprB
LLPKRDGDTLGFAFAQLKDSPAFRRWRNPDSGNENYYELYYAIQVAPWFVVTPDIQYIDNPGGTDTISHAIAGGVRFRVTF